MRLRGVKSKEKANAFLEEYLPVYNRRFMRVAKSKVDLHRKIPRSIQLKQALSIQTERVLRNDNTVRHEGKFYQIQERWTRRRPKRIVVQERVDGKLYLMDRSCELRYKEIKVPPKPKEESQLRGFTRPRARPLAKDNPWRRFRYSSKEPNRGYKPAHSTSVNALGKKISNQEDLGYKTDTDLSTYSHNSQRKKKKQKERKDDD